MAIGSAELLRQVQEQLPEQGDDLLPADSPTSAMRRMMEEEAGISFTKAHSRVMDRFQEAKDDRRGRELTWWLCTAFYLGDHYAQIEKESEALLLGSESSPPSHRVRAVNNKITPAADELVARLVRSRQSLSASPKTENPQDYDGALVATSILTHEERRFDRPLRDHDVRLWAVLTGIGGIWTRWNDGIGAINPETGKPRGEIEPIVVPPFHMYPDPAGSRFDNMGWFIHASEESVEVLQSMYPELAEHIGPDAAARDTGRHFEDRIKALAGASLGLGTESGWRANTTTVITYWEPPTPDHPWGLMVIATPGIVLWMGPNPWAHYGGTGDKWCPVDIFRYRAISNSFWGQGAVESAIPLQKELNRTLSQILENRNEVGNPGYWVPRGCKVNQNQWRNQPGERRWYTPTPPELSAGGRAYRPEREDPPPIPGGLFKLIADLKAEIEDVFSYHQVSKGGAPPGVRSGVAIEQLQETDQAGAVPIIERHNVVWSNIGERILTLVHDHWEDERVVEVRGDEGYSELRAFRGADIPSNLSVTVETEMLLPITRSARLQALMEMVKMGIITPEYAAKAIFTGFGSVRSAIFKASLDQRKQNRENLRMAAGEIAEVDNFDDHQVHLRELNDFRKTPTYERIKGTPVMLQDPSGRPLGMAKVADLFELHAQAHARALFKQMAWAPPAPGATEPGPGGQPGMTEPEQADRPRMPMPAGAA